MNQSNGDSYSAHVGHVFPLSLSSAQRRIWFVDQLESGRTGNQFTCAFRLHGELDESALEAAVKAVVERHGILRTRFVEVDGNPAQIVETNPRIVIDRENWGKDSENVQAERLSAFLKNEWDEPFKLSVAPMFRMKLLRLGVNDYILVQTFHYIVSDQTSLEIFFQELFAAYIATKQRHNHNLQPLSLQYADFVTWEQSYLERERLAGELLYWKNRLGGVRGVALPYRGTRSEVSTSAEVYHATLPAEQFSTVTRLGEMQNASTQAILAAALSVMLAKLSSKGEYLIACPLEVRHDPAFNPLIGCFLNIVPLLVGIEEWTQDFCALLESVQKTVDDAYLHSRLPFEVLVAEVSPDRGGGLAPFCSIELDFHGAEYEVSVVDSLQVERLRVDKHRVGFDLEINVYQRDGGLDFDWVYKRDLFDHDDVAQMAGSYLHILRSAIANPHTPLLQIVTEPVEALPFLDAGTRIAGPELLIPELFEREAARQPDAIAIVCGEEVISYAALRSKIDELALQLRRLGAGPEAMIGICIPRSVELMIAFLAVLKTGSTCVPIAPELPFARKSAIIDEAHIDLALVTMASGSLPRSLRVLQLDETVRPEFDGAELTDVVRLNSQGAIYGEQAAYVVYTSGSTGRPNGVVVSHESLANKVRTINQHLGVGTSTKYAATAPIAVDPLFEQILCPLCAGGQVIVVPEEVLQDRAAFSAYCCLHDVTAVDVTPAFAEHLFENRLNFSFETLVVGGDVFPAKTANRLLKSGTARRLFNVYGPTEGCIDATAYEITAELKGSVPIGRALPNYQLFVLDEQLRPVGINVVGELYIAGVGIARGYLNKPSLTAGRFVACPFDAGTGRRMYRTGDWARWRSDFTLEFAGRTDDQIKIRGYRVEPEEIRVVLQEVPGVKDALVIAYERSGHKELAAYIVTDRDEDTFCRAVVHELRSRLPEYAVPSTVVPVRSWPLTTSGKIDHRALPQPGANSNTAKRWPSTRKEWELSRIFAELLSVPVVGLDDNFFELGGHSLLAMRLVSRVQDAFGIRISLRGLFDCPTIAQLVRHLSDQPTRQQLSLVPQPRSGQSCLSFAQRRLWVIDQLEKGNCQYNWPEGWRLRGELSYDVLKRALTAISDRHESLRTRFLLQGDTPVQVIAPSAEIDLPIEDLSGLSGPEREARIRTAQTQQWDHPFDLATGPLFRVNLLKLEKDHHILLLTVHHIVWDGWSQSIFIQELGALYEAFHQGRGIPLEPLPVQYADFALWQRKWLDEGALADQLKYWRGHLAGMPLELSLPRDHSRKPVQTFASDVCKTDLSADLFKTIKHFSDSQAATPFMTLFAVLSILFSRYSGQDDIVIGSPIANRSDPKLEQLIGFFVNSLVMRVRVSPGTTFTELVAQVRTVALDAYLNQDLPFERLVEELSVERHLNRTPIFQVVFAMLDAVANNEKSGSSLQYEHLPVYAQRVRFDLEIHAIQHPGHIELEWIYNRSLFDGWRIQQMSRHFTNLLHEALANPQLRVEQLSPLDAGDKHLLLAEFNGSGPAVAPALWPELFESQVTLAPDASAVASGDAALSYGELNERANQLAHVLIGFDAGPERVVCIAMESSFERVVAIVAVLKAGAACLVLDRHVPAMRLERILENCHASLVLVAGQETGRLSAQHVIALDAPNIKRTVSSAPRTNPTDRDRHSNLLFSNPAYLIYTSGSTGIPKGVCVTHEGLAALAQKHREPLQITHQSRIAQFAAPTFDAFVWEMMMAFFTGATLVLIQDAMRGGSALQNVFCSEQITHALLPPTVLATLNGRAELPLETLIVGGEACSPDLVRQWSYGRRMINAYGPTESTVCATLSSPLAENEVAPIGQPVRGTLVYVLDANLELAAAGVPGELYISGQGLARGYANNPGLTALSFVANPFGPPGARMYRSGDLVRWRVDGALEFLGRNDRQVKVRGVRIELAEVEAALMRDSHVLEAVATAKETKLGQQLLAYVVEKPGQHLPPDFEENHLQEWEALYDSTYAGEKVALGDFNIVGWNSSYTGKPISSSEMQMWLAESIERIRKLRPRRVAEVGCGTGLLLTRLAPEGERYVGIDFSEKAIRQVGDFIAHRREMAHVTLYKGLADKLDMIDDRSVDLTIINSVTQYFPSIDYLMKVLNEAVRITADGGHIFVGDVRNAALLEAFHTSTQVDKLPISTSLHEVRQRVMEACNNEKELLVHPELFLQFCRHHERLGRAEMSVKSGAYDNELSRFRYDVVLKLGPRHSLRPPDECLMWDLQGNWHTSVEKLLAGSKTRTVALRGFPDGRVSASIEAARILRSAPPSVSTLAQLKKSMVKASGEDPKAIFEICKRLDVEVLWQGWNEYGIYDVLINPRWEPMLEPSPAPSVDFAKYGNTPGKRQQRKKLSRILQQQLKESLPDYMVPSAVVVLPSWPLTGSGKIDIKALPAPDAHSAVQRRSPGTAKEAILCSLVADILGRESVDLDESFFALGGDSILSIQLVSRARSAGLAITPGEIFQHPTVAALARIAREDSGRGVTMPAETNGPVLPTPIMRWMLEWSGIPRAFFQAQLLQTPPRLSLHELEIMLQALVDHHEGLRSRLVAQADLRSAHLSVLPPGSVQAASFLERVDVSSLGKDEQLAVAREQARIAGEKLEPERGRMIRAVWLDAGSHRRGGLLLVVHHLVVDGVSWRILMSDLSKLWDAVSSGRQPVLPDNNAGLSRWSRKLDNLAKSKAQVEDLSFWLQILNGPGARTFKIPLDRGRDTVRSSRQFTTFLPASLVSAMLTTVCTKFRAQLNDIFVTALALALATWRSNRGEKVPSVVLELEGHGRECLADDIDLSRTVGWFTATYPVPFEIEDLDLADAWRGGPALGKALKRFKERLRNVSKKGLGYGLLRYLNDQTAPAFAAVSSPDVRFNYLGHFAAAEETDWSISDDIELGDDPNMPMSHALMVDVLTLERRSGCTVHCVWSWAPAVISEDDVRGICQAWMHIMEAVAQHCMAPDAGGLTPSDVPLVSINQDEIEFLTERMRQRSIARP